jgi:hypothetical protein
MSDQLESILSSAKIQTETSLKSKRKKPTAEEMIGGWATVESKEGSIPYQEKDVSRWYTKDLLYFFQDKFKDITGEEFIIGLIPGQQNILLLQDAIYKYRGVRPNALETRDYIEWFLANKAVFLISRYNCFKMKFMYAAYEIERYYQGYGSSKSPEAPQAPKDTSIFSQETMESVYLISPENFVLKYGLILSVTWLMRKRNMGEQEAIKSVISHAESLCKKDKYEELSASTERHNSYPIWCKFIGLKKMLADLTDKTGEFFDILDTRFSLEASKFGFLDMKE